MVKLCKQPLPPDVTIKSDRDYRKNEVINILVEDCHGKCYICEDKPTTINVEHIVSHRSDPALRFDWANLFIACGHCNGIKHTEYDDILDPTECDPEEHIALSVNIKDNLIKQVFVEPLTTDSSIVQTVKLLNLVYNGGSTAIKKVESSNLRNEHLAPKIQRFLHYLNSYHEEPDIGYDELIKDEISRSSAFAAFKRKMVRDDPELSVIFANSLV